MINKKNIPLIIALAIPVLMIILVAAFIYLPGIGQKPKENFLYLTGNNAYNYGSQEYIVSGGHLVKNPPVPAPATPTPYYPPADNTVPTFYLYNVATNISTELNFQQAQSYSLDSSNTSSDNYTVERGSGDGGGLFFGGGSYDYNDWFIKGHNRSQKLNLKLTGADSYSNFEFLGWVINN